jgi:hypothetical protein
MASKLRKSDDGKMMVFYCPGCGCHHYADQRWTFNGDDEKPTFTPSIKVEYGKYPKPPDVCHFYVTDGQIQYLNDCTHDLKGKTVMMQDEE